VDTNHGFVLSTDLTRLRSMTAFISRCIAAVATSQIRSVRSRRQGVLWRTQQRLSAHERHCRRIMRKDTRSTKLIDYEKSGTKGSQEALYCGVVLRVKHCTAMRFAPGLPGCQKRSGFSFPTDGLQSIPRVESSERCNIGRGLPGRGARADQP